MPKKRNNKMAIKVELSGKRRPSLTRGKDFFEVNGKTVGECLSHLATLLHGTRDDLFYGEKNILCSNVKVLLNKEKIGADRFGVEVKEDDVIYLQKKFQ